MDGRLNFTLLGATYWFTVCFFLICLFSAVLGLHCRLGFSPVQRVGAHSSFGAQAFRCSGFCSCGAQARGYVGFGSCSSQALESRLSSCGTWAWSLCGKWDPPRSGIKPMSPALAGRSLTSKSSGKHRFPFQGGIGRESFMLGDLHLSSYCS